VCRRNMCMCMCMCMCAAVFSLGYACHTAYCTVAVIHFRFLCVIVHPSLNFICLHNNHVCRRRRFLDICCAAGVHTRVRKEMGQDIAGACGQLALVNPSTLNGNGISAASAPAAAASDMEDLGRTTSGRTGGGIGKGEAKVKSKMVGKGTIAENNKVLSECTNVSFSQAHRAFLLCAVNVVVPILYFSFCYSRK
jgi:hypothetical protein